MCPPDPLNEELPSYLLPLIEPRPSGEAKLLAAWDGLSTEHQILLLTLRSHGPLGLTTKIRGKALASTNAYVRYLAAQGFQASRDDTEEMALRKRIEDDPEPLVRYAPLEDRSFGWQITHCNDKPEGFFGLPHEAQLARARSIRKHMAEFIRHAIVNELPNGRVTEDELADLLIDYVRNPEFKSYYDPSNEIEYNVYAEYGRGEDIKQLWMLVPDLPKRVAYVLIYGLPEKIHERGGIPEKVLNGMNDEQLAALLSRADIGLVELRRKIFLESIRVPEKAAERHNDLRICAISCNFNPTHDEFAEILAKTEKERASILADLAQHASGLSLCIFQAVSDVLTKTEWSEDADPYGLIREATGPDFDQKLARLRGTGHFGKEQLCEWALYLWAECAVPWKKGSARYFPLSGDSEFLAKCIEVGDTWGTFMAFSRAWEAEAPESSMKAMEQALWQMAEADWSDERKKTLQDLGISKEREGGCF